MNLAEGENDEMSVPKSRDKIAIEIWSDQSGNY